MMSRSLKLAAGIFFAVIILLGSFGGSRASSYLQDTQSGQPSIHGLKETQTLDSSSHFSVGIPDGVLSSESGTISFIKTGRQGEETAESVLFLLGIFLIIAAFYFLLDGRPWAAVQSICMGFQDSTMHQIQILQLWDGKKGKGSHILNRLGE